VRAAVIEGDTLLCLEAGGLPKPLVPEHMRRQLFNKFHSLAHAGIIATGRMILTRFAWPGLATDVATWVKECRHCHLSKPGTLERTLPLAIPVPKIHFSHVHVDLVGPLPTSSTGEQIPPHHHR